MATLMFLRANPKKRGLIGLGEASGSCKNMARKAVTGIAPSLSSIMLSSCGLLRMEVGEPRMLFRNYKDYLGDADV